MTQQQTLTARIPIALGRGQNNREHHRVRAIRVAAERAATLVALATGDWRGDSVSLRRPELGARITLVRPYQVTPLDSDNLSASCKAVRDAIAQFLGVDDASDRLHWVYRQEPAVLLGKSTKPGKSRASPDRDTRPTVVIEVLPVDRIDPQAEALAQALARAEKAEAALDEVEEELGAIKEAVTQHLPTFVTDDGEDDELDHVETIEEAGRLLAVKAHSVSAGTYAKRVDERDAAIRERDELGIQLAALRERLRLAMEVVDEARKTADANWRVIDVAILAIKLAALDAVPGDVGPVDLG
jgi:hypothetical protein